MVIQILATNSLLERKYSVKHEWALLASIYFLCEKSREVHFENKIFNCQNEYLISTGFLLIPSHFHPHSAHGVEVKKDKFEF
jgi:deoxyadenosine/deoxycytidine kinase